MKAPQKPNSGKIKMENNKLKSKLEKSIEKAECAWKKPNVTYFIDYKNKKYLVTSYRNKKKSEELKEVDLPEIVEEIVYKLTGDGDWKRYIDIKCSSKVPERTKNLLDHFKWLCDSYVDILNSDKIHTEYIKYMEQTLSNIKNDIEEGKRNLEDRLSYELKCGFKKIFRKKDN